jgi:hypothetical protein
MAFRPSTRNGLAGPPFEFVASRLDSRLLRQTDIRSARASLVSGIKRIVHARVRDALTQKSPETKYLLVQDEQDSGPFYKPLVAVLVAVLNSSHLFFRKFYEPLVGQETLAGRCEPFNIERYGSAVAIS